MPNEIVDLLQPPPNDRLGVLTETARVVREASLVHLDPDAIERLATRWADEPWPENTAFPEMHYFDGAERTLNWLLLLDGLNFCFWAFPNELRWRVEWRGETLDGYNALAASLSHAMEDGLPLYDAAYLAALDEADARHDPEPRARRRADSALRRAACQHARGGTHLAGALRRPVRQHAHNRWARRREPGAVAGARLLLVRGCRRPEWSANTIPQARTDLRRGCLSPLLKARASVRSLDSIV